MTKGRSEVQILHAQIVELREQKVELLAALESAVDRLCYACDLKFPFISTNTHQHPKGGILSCEAAAARAAIAKAKGE